MAGRRGGGREREEEERWEELRTEASLTREFRSESLERDMVCFISLRLGEERVV